MIALRIPCNWSAVLAACTIACGGSGSGASGVPSNTKLSDLSAQDAMALCRAHANDFASIAGASCTVRALATASKTACETFRKQCETADAGAGKAAVDCTGANTSSFKKCSSTVGQVEECLSQTAKYFDGLSCDNATMALSSPPTCFQDIQTTCPSLLSGGSASSSKGVGGASAGH